MYAHESNITDKSDNNACYGSGYLKVEDAIEIAKKYAEEMCKKQRKTCYKKASKAFTYDMAVKNVLFAPLATEEE